MDNFEINRPERIIRRHGKSHKRQGAIGFYVYIGSGVVILLTLLTAIWLLIKSPSTPTEDEQIAQEGQLTIPSQGSDASIGLPAEDNVVLQSTPAPNEIPLSLPQGNEVDLASLDPTSATSAAGLIPETLPISNLPLDYALTANKLITTTASAKGVAIPSTPLDSTTVNLNKPSGLAPAVQPNVTQPVQPISDPQIVQTANAVQSQLNNAAVQVNPNIQRQAQVVTGQSAIVTSNPSTLTQSGSNPLPPSQPVIINPVKQKPIVAVQPTPKPKAVEPTKSKVVEPLKSQAKSNTPQTAVIKNSKSKQQTVARPAPPATITQQAVNPNVQESAASIQAQKNQTTQNQVPKASPKQSVYSKNASSRGRINNGTGGNYSIQVASASRPEGLRKLAVEQNLLTGRVIETQRDGRTWYVLITGYYATRNEAQNAISTLPHALQKNNPWIREAP